MTQHDDDRPSASDDVVEFPVAFTGVITDVSFVSIDPSGRSDLLKIIDEALSRRSIAPLQSVAPQSHRLSISRLQLCIRSQSTQLVQLRVPLHIIASVGYMLDDGLHIVCINIGPDPLNRQTRDLAVITVTCKVVADDVCRVLSSRFQSRYREAVVRLTDANVKSIKNSPSSFPPHRAASSSQQSPTSGGGGAGDSGQWRRHASTLLESAETKTSLYSTTSESNNDAVNDYLTLASSSLTEAEFGEYAELLHRSKYGELPLQELLHKLDELFGPYRKYLLTRLHLLIRAEDQAEFHEYLRLRSAAESDL